MIRRLAAIGIVTAAAGLAATTGALAAWLADRLLHADDRPSRDGLLRQVGCDDHEIRARFTNPDGSPIRGTVRLVRVEGGTWT